MTAKLHLLTLSLSLFSACAADDSTDSTDADEVGQRSSISGTYKEVGSDGIGLGYSSITFKSGGKLTAKKGSATHAGTWKISKSGTQYTITLDDDVDGSRTLYESWDSFQLSLDKDAAGTVSTNFYNGSWDRKIPIGDVCQDNNGNSLGECDDDGNFACGPDGLNDNLYSCVPLD